MACSAHVQQGSRTHTTAHILMQRAHRARRTGGTLNSSDMSLPLQSFVSGLK